MNVQEFKIFLLGILRTPGLHRLVSATYSSSEGEGPGLYISVAEAKVLLKQNYARTMNFYCLE